MKLIIIDSHEGGILSIQQIETSEVVEVSFSSLEIVIPTIADMIELFPPEDDLIVVEDLGPIGLLIL